MDEKEFLRNQNTRFRVVEPVEEGKRSFKILTRKLTKKMPIGRSQRS